MTTEQIRDRIKARCQNNKQKTYEYLSNLYSGHNISTGSYRYFCGQLERGIEPDNLNAKMTGKQA